MATYIGGYLISFRGPDIPPPFPIGVGPGEPGHLSRNQPANQVREFVFVRVGVTHQHPYAPSVANDDRANLDQLKPQVTGAHSLEGRLFQVGS